MDAMNIKLMLTDELLDIREKSRLERNYTLSDLIREELDSRGSFVFDHPHGQVCYHLCGSEIDRDWINRNRKEVDRSFETHIWFKK